MFTCKKIQPLKKQYFFQILWLINRGSSAFEALLINIFNNIRSMYPLQSSIVTTTTMKSASTRPIFIDWYGVEAEW